MFAPEPRTSVKCPEDRGDPAYVGRVLSTGTEVHRSHKGDPYVWVEVQSPTGRKVVWPSNRLEAA